MRKLDAIARLGESDMYRDTSGDKDQLKKYIPKGLTTKPLCCQRPMTGFTLLPEVAIIFKFLNLSSKIESVFFCVICKW